MIFIVIMTQPASIKLVTARCLIPRGEEELLEAREDKFAMQKEIFFPPPGTRSKITTNGPFHKLTLIITSSLFSLQHPICLYQVEHNLVLKDRRTVKDGSH